MVKENSVSQELSLHMQKCKGHRQDDALLVSVEASPLPTLITPIRLARNISRLLALAGLNVVVGGRPPLLAELSAKGEQSRAIPASAGIVATVPARRRTIGRAEVFPEVHLNFHLGDGYAPLDFRIDRTALDHGQQGQDDECIEYSEHDVLLQKLT